MAVWYAELIARPDRDAPHVRLAADVCIEFLAKPGSAFKRVIALGWHQASTAFPDPARLNGGYLALVNDPRHELVGG